MSESAFWVKGLAAAQPGWVREANVTVTAVQVPGAVKSWR